MGHEAIVVDVGANEPYVTVVEEVVASILAGDLECDVILIDFYLEYVPSISAGYELAQKLQDWRDENHLLIATSDHSSLPQEFNGLCDKQIPVWNSLGWEATLKRVLERFEVVVNEQVDFVHV